MDVQKHRVFQSRLIPIDDVSVFNKDCHTVVVTHADWMALEERYQIVRECCMSETLRATQLLGELTSLKSRVDELVEDAERWREFNRSGWPVCFLGVTYETSEALNAAVDDARKESSHE